MVNGIKSKLFVANAGGPEQAVWPEGEEEVGGHHTRGRYHQQAREISVYFGCRVGGGQVGLVPRAVPPLGRSLLLLLPIPHFTLHSVCP